jgi:hypothetical protein
LVHQALNADWEATKLRIFAELGSQSSLDRSMMQSAPKHDPSSMRNPPADISMSNSTSSSSTFKSQGYGMVVKSMNESNEKSLNVLEMMSQAYQIASMAQDPFMESWIILSSMLKPQFHGVLSFANTYLDPNIFSTSSDMEGFLQGARQHLENSFDLFIDQTIKKQPKAAMMGGNPSVLKRVEGFVRLRFKKYDHWDLVNPELLGPENMPVWVIIYYLLRCGHRGEAAQYVRGIQFSDVDETFPSYFKLWMLGELNQNDESHLHAYYSMLTQSTEMVPIDPYKLAVIKLIGRCDVRNKRFDSIVGATEDWIWVRLMLLGNDYTATELQNEVKQLDSYFSKQSPSKFFNMLLMCGLFENAVIYLYRLNEHKVDALHFALTLHYYGCLRIPLSPSDVRSMQPNFGFDPSNVPLHTMLQLYWETLNHESRLQYLLRLPHYSGLEGYSEWQEFARLQTIGWVRSSPKDTNVMLPIPYLNMLGLSSLEEFQKKIVSVAADQARDEDQIEDAIYLFAQSGNVSSVYDCLNQQLSRVFTQGPQFLGGGPTRSLESILSDADHVMNFFSLPDQLSAPSALAGRSTAVVLRDLVYLKVLTAKDDDSKDAWRVVESCNLVPVHVNSAERLNDYIQKVPTLPPILATCIPLLLRITMDLLLKRYKVTRDPTLKNSAHLVRIFAGRIPIKMDTQLHAHLAQREVEMAKI